MDAYNSVLWDRKIFNGFSPDEIYKLKNLFEKLPFSSHCILEFPTINYRKIDFSINLKSQEILQSYFKPTYDTNYSILKNASEFIADVWVEFDSTEKDYTSSHFFSIKNFDHFEPQSVSRFIHQFSNASPLDAEEQLRKVLSVIPKDNIVSHVGFMQNRKFSPTRLNIKKAENNIDDLIGILDLDIQSADVWHIIKCADTLTLTVDVSSEGVGSRFGIECFFNGQESNNLSYQRFISKLIELGYANSELADCCNEWIGVNKADETSSIASQLLMNIKSSYFWRIINHFKIVIEPNQVQVKVYLGFGHKWI